MKLTWKTGVAAALTLIVVGLGLGGLGAYVVSKKQVNRELKDDLEQRTQSSIQGCELTKKDRIDAARGARGQSDYLGLVLAAASVKGDVKAAATVAKANWDKTAEGLMNRLYLCEPRIRDGVLILDPAAIKEAQRDAQGQ